eukprot:689794-Pelagomonas_calceolata.AAC.1
MPHASTHLHLLTPVAKGAAPAFRFMHHHTGTTDGCSSQHAALMQACHVDSLVLCAPAIQVWRTRWRSRQKPDF